MITQSVLSIGLIAFAIGSVLAVVTDQLASHIHRKSKR